MPWERADITGFKALRHNIGHMVACANIEALDQLAMLDKEVDCMIFVTHLLVSSYLSWLFYMKFYDVKGYADFLNG